MEPVLYNQGVSARYYRLEEIESPFEEGMTISTIFQSNLARKLMKETRRELIKIRERYNTN